MNLPASLPCLCGNSFTHKIYGQIEGSNKSFIDYYCCDHCISYFDVYKDLSIPWYRFKSNNFYIKGSSYPQNPFTIVIYNFKNSKPNEDFFYNFELILPKRCKSFQLNFYPLKFNNISISYINNLFNKFKILSTFQ